VKAISLWQPYAVLCAVGAKRFETRGWETAYRGPLLIHASRKLDGSIKAMAESELVVSILRQCYRPCYNDWIDLPFGAIVGRAHLVACSRMRDLPPPSERERALGDWSPDRYAWELASPELFGSPIPFRGMQRLFNVNDKVMAA
jgi:hypothetical protein